jgi:hypothetical protein
LTADNVGYRDQRYSGGYHERTGKFVIYRPVDWIPQFYSVDTKTPTRCREAAAPRRRDAEPDPRAAGRI